MGKRNDFILSKQYERWVGQGLLPFYEARLRGRSTFRYRQEFEANQWRSQEEIAAIQWEKLRALLDHAYQTVPYYRSVFEELGIRPAAISSPADFAQLPVLEKATVRQQRDQLISSAFDRKKLIGSATGGSTGEPMRFYFDRNSYERRVAAAMRGDGWAGWRLCAGEFYIWGVPLLPESGFIRRKKQIHHASLRRAVVNSFELSAERIAAMVGVQSAAAARGGRLPNAIYEFARYACEAGLTLTPPWGSSAARKSYSTISASPSKKHSARRYSTDMAAGK